MITKYNEVNTLIDEWTKETNKNQAISFLQYCVGGWRDGHWKPSNTDRLDFYVNNMGVRNFVNYLCDKWQQKTL